MAGNKLVEDTQTIRSRTIPWKLYHQASIISDHQLELIERYDNKDEGQQRIMIEEQGDELALLFLNLATALTATDTLQYLLVLISDMLDCNEDNKDYYLRCAETNTSMPHGPFLSLVDRPDDFIRSKSLQILTTFAVMAPMGPDETEKLAVWLETQLGAPSEGPIEPVIMALSGILRLEDYRLAFFKKKRAVTGLLNVLTQSPNFQMQYEILFCLWLLTFNHQIASVIQKHDRIISPMIKKLKAETPKKVVRISVAVLKNLAVHDTEEKDNLRAIVSAKGLEMVTEQSARPFDDEDLTEDLEFLREKLQATVEDMTTFSLFVAELNNGVLEWGPTHTSPAFWSENAEKLNENNFEHLRNLLAILETSVDETSVAIAAHDVGEYVRVCPSGKRIIDKLDGKHSLMKLVGSSNEMVRQEALLATQKLMLNKENWKFVQEKTNN